MKPRTDLHTLQMSIIMKKSNKIIVAILLILCGVLFLIQDWWFISEWDDYFYKFIITDSTQTYHDQLDDGKHQLIDSFGDVIVSQYNHYLGSNGRFIVHSIVQVCTALLPRYIFPILNSVAFVMLLWVLIKLADKDEKPINSLFTTMSLLIGCPVVMAVFMANIAVSVNYLWSGAVVLWWYYMYERVMQREKEISPKLIIPLVIIGIVAGSMHEGYSIGLCAGLLLYHLFNIRKLTLIQTMMIGAFGLGACICIFAPSNFLRLGGQLDLRAEAKWFLLESYIFDAFVMLFVTVCIFARNKAVKFIKDNIVLLIAFLTSICFATLIVFTGAQQLTATKLLSCILFLRLLYSFDNKYVNIAKQLCVVAGLFLCVFTYPRMYELRKKLGISYSNLVEKAIEKKQRLIVDTKYDDAVFNVEHSGLAKYFNLVPINGDGNLSIHITKGKNRNYIEGIIPLPMSVVEEKCKANRALNGVTYVRNNTYVYVSGQKHAPESVYLHYLTTFRNPNKLHEVRSHSLCCVGYKEKYYYFFKSPSSKIVSVTCD